MSNILVETCEDLGESLAYSFSWKSIRFGVLFMVAMVACVYFRDYRVLAVLGLLLGISVLVGTQLAIVRETSDFRDCGENECFWGESLVSVLRVIVGLSICFAPAATSLLILGSGVATMVALAIGFLLLPVCILKCAFSGDLKWRSLGEMIHEGFGGYVCAAVILAAPWIAGWKWVGGIMGFLGWNLGAYTSLVTAAIFSALIYLSCVMASRLLGWVAERGFAVECDGLEISGIDGDEEKDFCQAKEAARSGTK